MRKDFYYPSSDGITQIHAIEWEPEGDIKGILQICHGMVEYIRRYGEFAEYMANQGYYVVGHDHLGHGESIQSKDYYGYFHESKGNEYVIGDIHKLRKMTEEKHPGVPYYILGHSMGSFLLRQYLTMYGQGLSGAVIMGTGHQGTVIVTAGKMVCKVIATAKGWKYRSSFVNNLSFGSYNKRFEPGETDKDWITSDKEKRAEYVADPLCSFTFTVNGYYHMLSGIKALNKKEAIEQIPKDLPLFMISGADDPVGGFGKGVRKVCDRYKSAGIKQIDLKLYEGDRHEILNETDRQQVYEDIYTWLDQLGTG